MVNCYYNVVRYIVLVIEYFVKYADWLAFTFRHSTSMT